MTFQEVDLNAFSRIAYLTIKNCTFLNELVFGGNQTQLLTINLIQLDYRQIRVNSIKGLRRLTTLKLEKLNLSTLDGALEGLENLSQLYILDCPLREITGAKGLSRLQAITIVGTALETLHLEAFPNNSALQNIFITESSLKNIFPLTHNNTSGRFGVQYDNEVWQNSSFCQDKRYIMKFPHLRQLRLGGNQVKIAPGNFRFLHSLQLIDLHDNGIDHIPRNAFICLKNLKSLYLFDNKIKVFPSSLFDNLRSLMFLDLHNNTLNFSASTYSNDTNATDNYNGAPSSALLKLSRLNLSNNNLTAVPKYVIQFSQNVRRFDLSDNNIQSVDDDSFLNLNFITLLDMSNNMIKAIHLDAFTNMKKLESLKLNMNFIVHIQNGLLDNLSQLNTLYLSDNSLSTIEPGAFLLLTRLRSLYLNNNSIIELNVKVFHGLQNLEYLYLQNNNISSLPRGIFFSLEKLMEMDLSNNRIKGILSGELLPLTSLYTLNLTGNRISDITKDMFLVPTFLKMLGNQLVCRCHMAWVNNIGKTKIGPSYQRTICINMPQSTLFDFLKRHGCVSKGIANPIPTQTSDDSYSSPWNLFMYVVISTSVLLVGVLWFCCYWCYCYGCYRHPLVSSAAADS